MKTKTILVAMAALSFMLTACGDKKANQVLVAENTTETKVEETTDEEDLDDSSALKTGELAVIRSVWEISPIPKVASGEKVDIERFAFAFANEYTNYEPNKALVDYLRDPAKYDNIDFQIESDKKNGFIKCMGMFQVGWDTSGCYWKRKNGHSLVAFWMEQGHESNPDLADNLLVFYDYDPSTDVMTPEVTLAKKLSEAMADYDEYSIILPQEGKDIELIGYDIDYDDDSAESTYYIGRWNGNDFNIEKEAVE